MDRETLSSLMSLMNFDRALAAKLNSTFAKFNSTLAFANQTNSKSCNYVGPGRGRYCPFIPDGWLDLPKRCCAMQPPSKTKKVVAVCIAGQVPRIFASVERTMSENVIKPLGEMADTFIAASGSFQRPPQLNYTNMTMVAPSNATAQARRMATTMQACYPMIEHAEERLQYQYAWVLRLRTDTLATFTWHHSSVWAHATGRDTSPLRVVFTTHCFRGGKYGDSDCTHSLPHAEANCPSDQFAVMSRAAAAAYLTGILSEISTDRSRDRRPPECVLGSALARHRVSIRALRLCGCGCHSACNRSQLPRKRNWSPSGGENQLAYLRAHDAVLQGDHHLPSHTYAFPLAHGDDRFPLAELGR